MTTKDDARHDAAMEDITLWLNRLVEGDPSAADVIWRSYWEKLVKLARQKLRRIRCRVADEEDVALSAFDSFCRGAAAGRFPDLKDRHDLWKLLVTITARKATAQYRREHTQKRGGRDDRNHSIFGFVSSESVEGGVEDVLDAEPNPEFALMAAERCEILLNQLDETLRQVALLRLEGYRVSEIAKRLNVVPATIRRRILRIQEMWSEDGA